MSASRSDEKRLNYNIDYPIRHGIVDNWDNMEKYWQRCIYQVSPVGGAGAGVRRHDSTHGAQHGRESAMRSHSL